MLDVRFFISSLIRRQANLFLGRVHKIYRVNADKSHRPAGYMHSEQLLLFVMRGANHA